MSSRHYAKQRAADLEALRAEDAGRRLGKILGVTVSRALEWHDGRFSTGPMPLGDSGWRFEIRLTPTKAECHIRPQCDDDSRPVILATSRPPAEWGFQFGILRAIARVRS